ncbi:MAG: AMP-binding protein, partial [Hyphomicrobiales bacterium]|nr:AMP-binding protein [Hyphomicrobiales bacterium]
NHVAHCLRDAGVTAGQPTVLAYPPGTEMAVAFFACATIGAIPVPAPPPVRPRQPGGWGRLVHIAGHAGATRVLTTTAIADQVSAAIAGSTEAPARRLGGLTWSATDRLTGDRDSFDARASGTLFIQYTSGSTQAPQGVAVTHENVIHNAGLCVDHDQPVGVSWLPHFHDMGLLGYFLFNVVRGGESHCFSPLDFLRRPVLWLDLITRVGATITTAPNAAYEYCLRDDKIADDQLDHIDLGSLRTMVNCAEPVRAATFERFWHRFAPHGLDRNAYVAGYGLAEHTLCVTTGGSTETRWTDGTETGARAEPRRLVSCGRPAADVDLRIVDPKRCRAVAAGGIGEIWVNSPSKAAGYWRRPAESTTDFEAKLADVPRSPPYLRTGDLGFLQDGELFVCGRLRDMVVVNGANIFPADIEAVLEERFATHLAGRVVAFGTGSTEAGGEQLTVLVEAGAEAPPLTELRRVIQETCDVGVGVLARVPRGTIARTSSGKIARRLCRAVWETGEVDAIMVLRAADDPGSDVEDLIARLVTDAESLGDPDATLDQLGLDSIALVDLSLAFEGLLQQSGLASPGRIEQVADLSLLQALRASEIQSAFQVFRSGVDGARTVLDLLDDAGAKLKQDEHDRMRADAAMPLPTNPATPAELTAPTSDEVLLTGATGFLGAFVLRSLIEQTDGGITVLIRARDPAHGAARVRQALLRSRMPAAAVHAALRCRLRVLPGDLALPRFGQSDLDWDTLAESIGAIYHCGAEVDYVKSYNLLRPANVTATRTVIELTTHGCGKSLHYISTTFVFGWSTRPLLREADSNAEMDRLDFGYAQSKWVAEQQVLRAQQQGVAATIYRPSLVTASAEGSFVRRDITARVLGYMIRHGLTVDARNQISFLPVDICARNIVALSRSDVGTPAVLHMTSDRYHTIAEICAVITGRFGYRFEVTTLEDFVAHAHAHCRPNDELYPLLSFLDRHTQRIRRMGDKRYDSRDYRLARDREPLALPHPDITATVEPIVAFLRREGLVASPLDRPPGRPSVAEPGPVAESVA